MKDKYFYGEKISETGVSSGWVDYRAAGRALGAELYEEFPLDADWELINGDDMVYYDSAGEIYDSESSNERIQELEYLIEEGKKNGQDTSELEEDWELLMYHGESRYICDYYKIPERSARILKQESNELVFYSSELDTYVWGMTHCGTSWQFVLTSIPIR